MRVLTELIIGVVLCTPAFGQIAPTQSTATTDDIFALRWNPAGLAVNEGFQFGLAGPLQAHSLEDASFYLSSSSGEGAFGLSFYKPGEQYHYRAVSSTALTRGMYFGYGITFGKAWYPAYSLGLLLRPLPYLSLGAVGNNLTASNTQPLEYRAGVALRPFGNRFTVGTDLLLNSEGDVLDTEFTLTTEIVDGVTLDAFYLQESQTVGVGIGVNLQHHQVRAVQGFAANGAGRYPDPVGIYQFSSARKRSVLSPVKRDKFILMEFDGSIPEERPRFWLFGARGRTLTELIMQIQKYSRQPDVAGIVLSIQDPQIGPAQVNEIRRALQQFRAGGKKVYAYLESGSNLNYLLASAADKIYLNPGGDLWPTGIASQLIYVKSLLQKVGVKAEFIRIGEYKTAGEMFTRDSASTANLEQLNAYLDDVYTSFTRAISRSRAVPVDSVKSLIDRGPYGARRALKTGLVDSLFYRDEFKKFIKEGQRGGQYRLLSEKEYGQQHDWIYDWESPIQDKIAIIYAVGPITTGESNRSPFTGSTNMGAETIAEALRDARNNPGVRAIVLRVDSPGGSALGSDIIWREVQLTSAGEDKKPVIVSMGDVAASGGYYISMAADTVLANPETVTGSIGVVFGEFIFKELIEKIGVHTQILKRGDQADMLDPSRDLTEDERTRIYQLMMETYNNFVGKAAQGRGMSPDSVDSLSRGRIYSGQRAHTVGLIDELGGIAQAISLARDAAGIPADKPVAFDYYPKYAVKLFDLLSESPTFKSKLDLPKDIQNALQQVEQMTFLTDEQILYLLPYSIQMEQ